MARRDPTTWKPLKMIEVINNSGENLLLELPGGLLRLDKGRTARLTQSASEYPPVKVLLENGKIAITSYCTR